MRGARVVRCGALGLLLVVGCSTDRGALDRFSRAYASFGDAATLTNETLQIAIDPATKYGMSRKSAMNFQATNESRAAAAETALVAYHREILPMMRVSAVGFGDLDSSVTALIEAANRIKNRDARAKAVTLARQAREMQTAFGRLLPLTQRRCELQVALLQDIIAGGGSFSALHATSPRLEEAAKLRKDASQKLNEVADHLQETKDTFSAMKGQFNLKSFPSKWEGTPLGGSK